MTRFPSGGALVAGVVGAPVRHSLSPLIHSAWIAAAGLDALYVPFAPAVDRFEDFVAGLRGGAICGLNVTVPFKRRALDLANDIDASAQQIGAANLLLFGVDGRIEARNTDAVGLMAAFAEQAPYWRAPLGPVAVLGAGGAARSALFALRQAGATVRLVSRSVEKAQALANGDRKIECLGWGRMRQALHGVSAIVNATSAGMTDDTALRLPLEVVDATAVVMDMVYKPLRTPLLVQARAAGLLTVDGLAMLIGQARPSFQAFFGQAPLETVDVRALALASLGEGADA